ncbi:MAG TPA: class I SAM-dependent methyltransferase [Lacipirellulaceae bacterium]|jgi:cyclopropane-fatty-acyl-phospholipid synthase|nr:class I SAM-dependent methyltransferase [Lacipirellulaceae bacterium]
MATIATAPVTERDTASAVRTCYDLLTVVPACGLTDFTDGKYVDDRNDRAAYVAAQERQAEYLLDQVRCGTGTRLLDIGCGYGRILEHAVRRGSRPVGLSISPPQVAADRARGLDVRELNYRHIFCELSPPLAPPYKGGGNCWEHAFDAIVANGSLEHFVQLTDAVAGRTNEIYEEMFSICHRLLVDGGRFVTTAIHFRDVDQFDPAEIARRHRAHRRGSDNYQYAMLVELFGGWYPEPGQLARCAGPYFELVEEEDGTHDYYLTSEHWQRRFFRSLTYHPRVWWALGRQLMQHPRAACEMFKLQVFAQSWPWQFRPPAPMRLIRQTWVAK